MDHKNPLPSSDQEREKVARKKQEEVGWLDWLKVIGSAIVIAFFISTFIVSSTVVEGRSMQNTLHNGDRLFVMKLGSSLSDLKRGEIVVFHAPDAKNMDYIKRIVALPGEYVQIENGLVYVNGKRLEENYINTTYTHTGDQKEWVVGEKQIFVLGDNRQKGASKDSRVFGPIDASRIIGHAAFRYYPFTAMGGLQ